MAASNIAISSTLVKEEQNSQRLVYYTRKALVDAKTRHPPIDKVVLVLLTAINNLWPYFQAHTITIYTDLPLRLVLQKPDVSSRLMKWEMEPGEYDIHYKSRTAIKGQVVADFIGELTNAA